MTSKQTQAEIYRLLLAIFGDCAKNEWNVRSGATDVFINRLVYAPRVDIAVGPFNKTQGTGSNIAAIIRAGGHPLIEEITAICKEQNDGYFSANKNPRCMLAIEIEFSGSLKHILGDFTNASMMGLVGLVVGPPPNIKKIERVGHYARALRKVEKASIDLFANVAAIPVERLMGLLARYA